MKLTKTRLNQIIKEEFKQILEQKRDLNPAEQKAMALEALVVEYNAVNRSLDTFGTMIANSPLGELNINRKGLDMPNQQLTFLISDANIRYLKEIRLLIAMVKKQMGAKGSTVHADSRLKL